jgi:hypothetical protein
MENALEGLAVPPLTAPDAFRVHGSVTEMKMG